MREPRSYIFGSVVLSLCLHAFLAWMSPRLELGGAGAVEDEAVRMFRLNDVQRELHQLDHPAQRERFEAAALLSDEKMARARKMEMQQHLEQMLGKMELLSFKEPGRADGPLELGAVEEHVLDGLPAGSSGELTADQLPPGLEEATREAAADVPAGSPRPVPTGGGGRSLPEDILLVAGAPTPSLSPQDAGVDPGGQAWSGAMPGSAIPGSGPLSGEPGTGGPGGPAGMPVSLESAQPAERYEVLEQFLGSRLLTYHEKGEERGYFMLRLGVRQGAKLEVMPQDVVFVIDTSGSMGQLRVKEAVRGVSGCLKSLRSTDRFNVVSFKGESEAFRPGAVPASPENVSEALEYLRGLRAGGKTNVYRALLPLVGSVRRSGGPANILLISDGRPTEDEVRSHRIINEVAREPGRTARVFAVSGGSVVNRYLLDFLAYRNGGKSLHVRREWELEEGVIGFFETLRIPVLINMRARYAGVDPRDIYPKVLPDFYRGGSIDILGRFGSESEIVIRVVGEVAGESKEFIFREEFPREDTGTRAVAELWGWRKFCYLVGRIGEDGAREEWLSELGRLTKRFGIRNPYGREALGSG